MRKVLRFVAVFMALSVVLSLTGVWASNNDGQQKGSPLVSPQKLENSGEESEKPASFSVPTQLRSQVQNQIEANKDIRNVKILEEEERVEVRYRLRAKLFGIIDVPYELQARVETKNMNVIEASGPWWLVFATDNAGEVKQALQDDATLSKSTNQGQILSKIVEILKSLAR